MVPFIIKDLSIEKNGGRKVFGVKKTLKDSSLNTKNIPLGIVQNIMDLHNEANPGVVRQFATSLLELGNGDKLINDVIRPMEPGLDVTNPSQTMLALYKYSFLYNEEASSLVTYSLDGKLIGFAFIGNFTKDEPSCSISNLSLSPKASGQLHAFMMNDLREECKKLGLEACLLADSSFSKAYSAHGFQATELPSFPKCVLYKYRT